MRVRELVPWPPTFNDSRTHNVVLAQPLPARLRRCGIYSTVGSLEAYLSVIVEHQGHDWHAMIQGVPEVLLRRIEATLTGQSGRTLEELGDLEVVDPVDPSTSPFAYRPRPERQPPRE